MSVLFFFYHLFIQKAELPNDRKRQRDLSSAGLFYTYHNGLRWADLRSGARSLIWTSHMIEMAQVLWTSSAALPGALVGSCIKSGTLTGAHWTQFILNPHKHPKWYCPRIWFNEVKINIMTKRGRFKFLRGGIV